MEQRKFGQTNLTPSILGFGMMRLKKKEDGTLDEEWAVKTLRYAIDHGINYVDTAYIYGDSERVTGLCLKDGYREKVTLATKLPVSMLTCEEDFDRLLDEQLERLQTDHIDAYLLHALSRSRWEDYVEKFHILDHAERARREGKIRYLGFSFHDNFDMFQKILNSHDRWDFCQIQLNYMDTQYQAGLEGLELAHQKGLAVVIMEPLRGGYLANVPEDIAKLLPKSPVESALDYLWNMEQVNVVLSGMSETEQVEQNLDYASRAHVGMLTDDERKAIELAGDKIRTSLSIPCTGCNYCAVCTKEIAIPEIFKLHNQLQLDGDYRKAKTAYLALEDKNAEHCISCGACAEQCPQQISIPQKLADIHKRYA